jgi:hypothetical protein
MEDERCPVEVAATAKAELTSMIAEKKCIVVARSNDDVRIAGELMILNQYDLRELSGIKYEELQVVPGGIMSIRNGRIIYTLY